MAATWQWQVTGEPLTRRSDDTAEKLKSRLEAFHKQTKPVVDHYSALGKTATIDASKGMAVRFVIPCCISHNFPAFFAPDLV